MLRLAPSLQMFFSPLGLGCNIELQVLACRFAIICAFSLASLLVAPFTFVTSLSFALSLSLCRVLWRFVTVNFMLKSVLLSSRLTRSDSSGWCVWNLACTASRWAFTQSGVMCCRRQAHALRTQAQRHSASRHTSTVAHGHRHVPKRQGFTSTQSSQVRGIPPLYNLLKGILSAMQGMAWCFGCRGKLQVLDSKGAEMDQVLECVARRIRGLFVCGRVEAAGSV